jgi:hypothetical protein
MKIVAVSDTHGRDFFSLIEGCDLLLIGGDIEPVDSPHTHSVQKIWWKHQFIPQLKELSKRCKNIAFIAGNHSTYLYDLHVSNKNAELTNLLPSNVHYLCESSVTINDLKIYGSPWCNAPIWANIGPPVWNFASGNHSFLEAIYADIPDDVDIILSHGPAHGFCDQILDSGILDLKAEKFGDNASREKLGCVALTNRILEIANGQNSKLKYVLNGHIHSARHDFHKYLYDIGKPAVQFACCSILDEQYKLGYKPLVFTVPE